MPRVAAFVFVLAGLAMFAAIAVSGSNDARAAELLANGEFDAWGADGPEGWLAEGAVEVHAEGFSGQGLAATATATIAQFVTVSVGERLEARAQVRLASGSGIVSLAIAFHDASFLPLGVPTIDVATPGAAFEPLGFAIEVPDGAALARLSLTFEPAGAGAQAIIDSASLVRVDAPEPTPTPTDVPEPTASATGTGTGSATPTRTATPGPGEPSALPTPVRGAGSLAETTLPEGESLYNRAFEFSFDGLPLAWDNNGGRLTWGASDGRGETGGATLISLSDSTKSIFQVVPVEPGSWYRATAWARIGSGEGDTWISLLWYASVDASGSNIGDEAGETVRSYEWTELALGPVQAPPGARSVRFRLMLRSPFPAAATFDDASLLEVEPSAQGGEQSAGPIPVRGSTQADAGPPPIATAVASSELEAPRAVVPLPPRTGAPPQVACAVCITEVVADPAESGRDAPLEWVEVWNRSGAAVDLGGWSMGDAKSLSALPAYILEPGAYVVLAGKSASFDAGIPVIVVDGGEIGSGLNNDTDDVRLLDAAGATVDLLKYGPDTGLPAAAAGYSLALDQGTGEWLVDWDHSPGVAAEGIAPASPTGTAEGAPDATAGATVVPDVAIPRTDLPITEGGPRTDRIAWVLLGACVAVGVFTVPFAWQRAWPAARKRWKNGR